MENLDIQSSKIQNLLLSIPALSFNNLKYFLNISKEEKYKILSPISIQLQDFNLTIDNIIDSLDTYSKILNFKNIDGECENIRAWLLERDKENKLKRQDEDGSWPLAGDPKDNYESRKNAWANAICSLALLKFRRYKNLYDKSYDEVISNSKKWLFDTDNKIYIEGKGWKKDDEDINLYETCIALNAVHFPRISGHTERLGYNITL